MFYFTRNGTRFAIDPSSTTVGLNGADLNGAVLGLVDLSPYVTISTSQTVTNKTFSNPVLNNPSITGMELVSDL